MQDVVPLVVLAIRYHGRLLPSLARFADVATALRPHLDPNEREELTDVFLRWRKGAQPWLTSATVRGELTADIERQDCVVVVSGR